MLAAILAQPCFLGPFPPGHGPEHCLARDPRRGRPRPGWPRRSFARGRATFPDRLFGVGRDLKTEFPAEWQGISHLALASGSARGQEAQVWFESEGCSLGALGKGLLFPAPFAFCRSDFGGKADAACLELRPIIHSFVRTHVDTVSWCLHRKRKYLGSTPFHFTLLLWGDAKQGLDNTLLYWILWQRQLYAFIFHLTDGVTVHRGILCCALYFVSATWHSV